VKRRSVQLIAKCFCANCKEKKVDSKHWKVGQKIRVVNPELEQHQVLRGETGTITRRCISDISAWVEMDKELPEELRVFPKEDSRGKHINLYPDECEHVAE